MKTKHQITFSDSKKMESIPEESVDLVVTSPPYPMIEMWDHLFSEYNPKIEKALKNNISLQVKRQVILDGLVRRVANAILD